MTIEEKSKKCKKVSLEIMFTKTTNKKSIKKKNISLLNKLYIKSLCDLLEVVNKK